MKSPDEDDPDMDIEILRYTPYNGPYGNAVGFFDVNVRTGEQCLQFRDLKLYQAAQGLKVSEKQTWNPDLKRWVKVGPLIPESLYEPIRQSLVARHESEHIGQLALF